MLITPEYLKLNYQLHSEDALYGNRNKGLRYGDLLRYVDAGERILDYGCGKGMMGRYIRHVTNYDPVTYPENPLPHPVVACIDVLEHVEPDCLDNVLQDISRLTQRLAYLVICRSRGTRTLPNGVPAHRIVKDAPWWTMALLPHFADVEYANSKADGKHDMTFICRQ
jgi:2-polyprenyl-3-methyl-5-hydroxy-6-metoxy-1,4-benzoquinol methylase